MEPSYPYPRGNNPEDFVCNRCGTWFTRWRTNGIEYKETLSNLKEIEWRAERPWLAGVPGCSGCLNGDALDSFWRTWIKQQPATLPHPDITQSDLKMIREEAGKLIRSGKQMSCTAILSMTTMCGEPTDRPGNAFFQTFTKAALWVKHYTGENSKRVNTAVLLEYKDIKWLLAWDGPCPPPVAALQEE